jgi:cytochrome P450
VIRSRLIPITEERIEERIRKAQGHPVPEHKDCIQWVMESSPRSKPWTAERIVHELMALWFGSVHIVTTNICFAVHDICLYPEYLAPLRKELDSGEWEHFEQTGKGLPLLDSFLKESGRTTPTESMSSRRMALEPFSLSDGTQLNIGDWLVTPLRAMSRDERFFENATEFHAFRHVDAESLQQLEQGKYEFKHFGKPNQFTSTDDSQIWGTGRMACPGRFYATAVMKSVMAAFIRNYEIELANPASMRHMSWRSFIYPLPTTKITVQPLVKIA